MRAEPTYTLTLVSDDRFRGQSTSSSKPALTGTIAYDDLRGPYLGVSVTAGLTGDGIRLLRSVQYLGYARRVGHGLSIDLGVTHRFYTSAATVEYARQFTEFYAGLAGRRVSARLSYSPAYHGQGNSATYGEVDALLLDRGDWSLNAHVGALAPPMYGRHPQRFKPDGQLGLTRRLDRLAISATLVGGGPSERDHRYHGTLVVAATRNF